jgi:outer membrane protein OmpA-like peptidoglycan-associated protein
MRSFRILRLVLSGALAFALASCATGPAKNPGEASTAPATHGTGAADKAGWKTQQQALERQLRTQTLATDATVFAAPDGLRLRLPASAVFVTDSLQIRPEGRYLLAQLAPLLNSAANTQLTVRVYGDSLDDSAAARGLTAARALAVTALLQEQGIAAERLKSAGAGQADPVAANDTPEGRRANRRLEITISPLSF